MSGNKNDVYAFFLNNTRLILIGLLLLILSFLLSSCGGYVSNVKEVNYFTGTEGLEMSFLEQAPPDQIYEESYFNVNIVLENKGAYDVVNNDYALLSITYDPFYIDVSGIENTDNVEVNKNSIILKGMHLYGKSKYHPLGQDLFLNFPNFKTKKIVGQREKPDTQIFTSLCYPYVTQFANLVCLDLSHYGQNIRRQVCSQEDLSLSDQGAPVAITRIEVENQPAGNESVRPVYTIYVRNKGSGTVISPFYSSAEFERVCSFEDLKKEDFNTIDIRVLLSNSKELTCNPTPIRLFDGEGFTRCTVHNNDLILGHQNYQTPLTINLSYVYLTSISKDIEIKRLNVYGGSTEAPEQCLPSEVQQGDKCITKCAFCAQNPSDSKCQILGTNKTIEFKTGFACQCGADTCIKLYPKGLCAYASGFCPGANYCCLPECKSSEGLADDGKCYTKCSECSDPGDSGDKCACGDDDQGYIVADTGYCCHDNKRAYVTQEDCKTECT